MCLRQSFSREKILDPRSLFISHLVHIQMYIIQETIMLWLPSGGGRNQSQNEPRVVIEKILCTVAPEELEIACVLDCHARTLRGETLQ